MEDFLPLTCHFSLRSAQHFFSTPLDIMAVSVRNRSFPLGLPPPHHRRAGCGLTLCCLSILGALMGEGPKMQQERGKAENRRDF